LAEAVAKHTTNSGRWPNRADRIRKRRCKDCRVTRGS
jgi:hypothetical protein